MRINELLEGKKIDDLNYVKISGDKREIDYDLVEDLAFFMNNDDNVYRKHVYPSVSKCLSHVKLKVPFSHNLFKPAVENSYKLYIQKFPIRELPDMLDEKTCEQVCKKMHEDLRDHIKDGKYKD